MIEPSHDPVTVCYVPITLEEVLTGPDRSPGPVRPLSRTVVPNPAETVSPDQNVLRRGRVRGK